MKIERKLEHEIENQTVINGSLWARRKVLSLMREAKKEIEALRATNASFKNSLDKLQIREAFIANGELPGKQGETLEELRDLYASEWHNEYWGDEEPEDTANLRAEMFEVEWGSLE